MTGKSNDKGKQFEAQIEELLKVLQSKYPEQVKIVPQMRLKLLNDQEFILDFDLRYILPTGEQAHWIELQDRKRSSPQIAQKIKYAKGLSKRNRFMFVYRDSLPEATRKALEADGVLVFSYEEFVTYIIRLDMTLSATANVMKLTIENITQPTISIDEIEYEAELNKLQLYLKEFLLRPDQDPDERTVFKLLKSHRPPTE